MMVRLFITASHILRNQHKMANTKITALTGNSAPLITDIIPMVDDPDGTAATQKLTLGNLALLMYPIGAIYTSVDSTTPATLFGGTWSAFGAGRVMVGLDSSDTDFDTVEETGGAKTVTLTAAQSGLPQHTHTQDAHRHQMLRERSATTGGATTLIARTSDTSSTSDTNVFTENTTAVNQNAGPTAAAEAHTNVQPYIVVYMWKRT